MRARKTAGQEPFAAGSRIATHSTWWVIGKMSASDGRFELEPAQAESDSRLALIPSAPGFCPALAGSHSTCPWQHLRWHDVPCHQARRNVTSWGESGEYRRSRGARGENRPRNAARSRKTLKDLSAQVRGGHGRIDAGQRHQVDNFMTKSSCCRAPASPQRQQCGYAVAARVACPADRSGSRHISNPSHEPSSAAAPEMTVAGRQTTCGGPMPPLRRHSQELSNSHRDPTRRSGPAANRGKLRGHPLWTTHNSLDRRRRGADRYPSRATHHTPRLRTCTRPPRRRSPRPAHSRRDANARVATR
jgi:hypothetical protein